MSLLMVPTLVVSYVVAYFAGTAAMDAFGLVEGDSLKEAGAWGVVIGLSLIVLIVVPQIIGIVLGVRAHRLGEVRLGRAGIVLNAAIATYLVLSSVLQLALA
jgi:hypothetical protein